MVFRNVAVGVWSYDTHTNTNVPWGTRMPLLRAAVETLRTFRDREISSAQLKAQTAAAGTARDDAVKQREMWSNASSRFSMIFVAPEYMFMGTCAASLSVVTDDRFLGENDQRQIVADVENISSKYGNQLVLVPGTVAYKKPFLKAGDTALEISARATKTEQRLEWGAQQIKSSWATQGVNISDAQARTVGLSGPMSGRNARTTNDKLNLLRSRAGDNYNDIDIGQNTMYMLHRGKIIGTYRKRCDFHEVLPGDVRPTIFVPGHKSGRATVGGIPLGMEICLDHGVGVLNTASSSGSPPAVHILCSAAVAIKPDNVVVRDGGYILHASSSEACTCAWRLEGNNFTDIITAESNVGNGKLRLGVAELDIA